MLETYRSRAYHPDHVAAYYLAWDRARGLYVIYEVNANNLTLREIRTAGDRLPALAKAQAQRAAGSWPPQVRLKERPPGL